MSVLSLNLKNLREKKKLTQKELADVMNISQTSIAHYEKGDRQPSIPLLMEFADYFNVSVDQLIGNNMKRVKKKLALDKSLVLKDLNKYLIEKNHSAFIDYIERLLSVMDLKIVIEEYLRELLYQVGVQWEKGTITEADEHYATHIVRKSINSLTYYDTMNLRRKKAVAFSVANERHTLGIELVSDLLEKHGIETLYLGSDVPIKSLHHLIDQYNPDYIFVSITLREHINHLVILIESLSVKPIQKIFIGGQGVTKLTDELTAYQQVKLIYTLDELINNI
jgi:methanogenic corrinoid protein MtbC1